MVVQFCEFTTCTQREALHNPEVTSEHSHLYPGLTMRTPELTMSVLEPDLKLLCVGWEGKWLPPVRHRTGAKTALQRGSEQVVSVPASGVEG